MKWRVATSRPTPAAVALLPYLNLLLYYRAVTKYSSTVPQLVMPVLVVLWLLSDCIFRRGDCVLFSLVNNAHEDERLTYCQENSLLSGVTSISSLNSHQPGDGVP